VIQRRVYYPMYQRFWSLGRQLREISRSPKKQTLRFYISLTERSQRTHHRYPKSRHWRCHPQSIYPTKSACPLPQMLYYPQFPINVKSLVGSNFHPSHALAWTDAILERRFELIAPRTPPTVAVAVVVAAQKFATTAAVLFDGEWYIDGFKELFAQFGRKFAQQLNVVSGFRGGKPAEEVPKIC
jgi:hypothetical protein